MAKSLVKRILNKLLGINAPASEVRDPKNQPKENETSQLNTQEDSIVSKKEILKPKHRFVLKKISKKRVKKLVKTKKSTPKKTSLIKIKKPKTGKKFALKKIKKTIKKIPRNPKIKTSQAKFLKKPHVDSQKKVSNRNAKLFRGAVGSLRKTKPNRIKKSKRKLPVTNPASKISLGKISSVKNNLGKKSLNTNKLKKELIKKKKIDRKPTPTQKIRIKPSQRRPGRKSATNSKNKSLKPQTAPSKASIDRNEKIYTFTSNHLSKCAPCKRKKIEEKISYLKSLASEDGVLPVSTFIQSNIEFLNQPQILAYISKEVRSFGIEIDTAISTFGQEQEKISNGENQSAVADKVAVESVPASTGGDNLSVATTLRPNWRQFESLFPNLANASITNLHLGARAAGLFDEKNIDTIGGFFRFTETRHSLYRERNIGAKTINEIFASREAFIQNLRSDDSCDWIQYARQKGFAIIPDKAGLRPGDLTMEKISLIVINAIEAQYSENQEDKNLCIDILTNRILKQYKQKETLEEIAIKHSVTRELIRQNEQEIIGILRSALAHGKYSLKIESKMKTRYRSIKFRFLSEIEQKFKMGFEVVSMEKNANTSFSRRVERFSEVTGFSSSEVNEHSDFLSDILGLALNPLACAGTENIELVKTVLDSAESILRQKQVRTHFEDIYRELSNRLPGMVAGKKWFYSKISRDSRFDSIGRSGYWVLKEWNLQTGPIFDCLTKILNDAEEPLALRQIILEVQKMNPCKPATIQNTLQNRSENFIKLPGNRYDLRERYPNRSKTDDEF